MTWLKIYPENSPTTCNKISDFDAIRTELNAITIDIQRWNPKYPVAKTASQEEILEAYSDQVSQIQSDYGFKSVDVINMNSSIPQEKIISLRNKFLSEHIHTDDEVRYFIEGQGLFCVHAAGKVYQILCEAGDFIAVPALTKHWFDMSDTPNFKCIRFFSDEAGWVAEYTGDDIASRFPLLEISAHTS